MNDKSIRKILISYLQTTNHEIRIYQEKSIGSSICDVMAVTDRLIGYEIKSNHDTLARLDNQIKEYTKFFDENYLVVSDKYAAEAIDLLPDSWGIIRINNDEVLMTRAAKVNKEVSRRRQLSMLWKLELKNLLIKNSLPLYAQKEKGYIADRLKDSVDGAVLGKQIANELLHRDYSVYDATDYTIYFKAEESFPTGEIVDILSEKDLSEFTLDKWIELYKHAMEIRENKESVFVKPVIERPKHEIPYTDIEVSLGVPWVSENIIRDFVAHLLETNRNGIKVTHESVTGAWSIDGKKWYGDRHVSACTKYGTRRYNALFITEALLNLREIKIYDGTEYNERETIAALEKAKVIEQEFQDWIWLDEDRRWEIEEEYNKLFQNYLPQTYDGSELKFPHMNPQYTLYPYQKDAVQKIMTTPNTLLAFDVGAGKTYIMIAAAMKMRQEGLSRKNMFVVPNHIVGQWEKIFAELYPEAKVLAIEPKGYKPEMRQKVLKQMKEGDYDGIIIAYSCFEMIPLSSQTVLNNMSGRLRKIDEAIQSLRRTEGKHVYILGWGETPLTQEADYIYKLTRDFLDSMHTPVKDAITFEDLAIDTIFLDEAHNYKNLPIRTKLKNLVGINTKGSKKCLDMLQKIRCVQGHHKGRGAVFATGTPLCNSISDAYAMQMYLQYEEMEKTKLENFDNWVKTFAKPEQVYEIDVDTSGYRMLRRFARFHNLPELSRMFAQIAIFHAVTGDGVLPTVSGYEDVVISKYPELCAYMKRLCERTEEIRIGKIDRKYDNMLKVSTDGRKAALDLKLVGEFQPEGQYSKVDNCVKNVAQIYHQHPNATQIIFCDYSTPRGEDYSVYQELKEKLQAAGISNKEIAFIHNYQTESRKVELYRKFNAGEMRIIIGSTFKLGIGANVQVKLKAIHHLDVPWRPADMVQREGRILRQGNENADVLIYRYITEGSFDAYSWQILETKQRFISQFLSGSSYQRTASDLEDNVLTYAEVKALALAEPLMKELAEKENEAKSLHIVIAKEKENRKQLEEELKVLTENLPKYKQRYLATKENAQYLAGVEVGFFEQEYKKIQELLTSDVIQKKIALPKDTTVLGFSILLPENQKEEKPYIYLERLGEKYRLEMSLSAKGNARRISNALKKFNERVKDTLKLYEEKTKRKEDIGVILQIEDHTYEYKLKECEARISEIKNIINFEVISA